MADIKNGKVPASSGGMIKLIDDSKVTDNQADIAAVASVIGAAAASMKTTQENYSRAQSASNVAEMEPNTIVLDSSPTTSFTIDEVPSDLQGAVNLTEAAKHDMVSTEVNLSTASQPSSSRWGMQAGAFGSEANANKFADTLRSQTQQPVNVHADGNLFRVTIGSFASKDAAAVQANHLGNTLGKKLVPVQIP